jgi:16S rRNA (cytidine1402-2'-O)-methyltransferase
MTGKPDAVAGTLFVVATPIGNLEDITLRALRILRQATLIAAEDTRHTRGLLTHYGIATPTTSFHEHNEREKTKTLLDRLSRGDDVALVSDAGTPGISDPGFRLIQAALAANIRVEPIPGATALIAALTASGLPTDAFTFVGFAPARDAQKRLWLKGLARETRTVVLYEAPHRVVATLEAIEEVLGDRWIVIARELTKVHEEFRRGWVSELRTRNLKPLGEFTILVSAQTRAEAFPAGVPEDGAVWTQFCHMTENDGLSRRDAISTLADRYGVSQKVVYQAIERGKNSG